MHRHFLLFLLLFLPCALMSQTDTTLHPVREGMRVRSSYAAAHLLLHATKPDCAFDTTAVRTKKQYRRWSRHLREAMSELMLPTAVRQRYLGGGDWHTEGRVAQPRLLTHEEHATYVSERWEFYPLKGMSAVFTVLWPKQHADGTAVLCLPGAGQSMSSLVSGMGTAYAEAGYIAVCVDNAAAGEQCDAEMRIPSTAWDYDYDLTSRLLLEMGWSWLGYTSFLSQQVLDWMHRQPEIRHDHIILSGFSLGTEPMMVLGVLNPDVFAFVYNDFLCNTQERALCVTAIDSDARRHFPNGIRHLIPGYWHHFNFPDVCAALAPRPLIFTEGGLDRDFRLVQCAYKAAGAPSAVTCRHQARYADANKRHYAPLPEGLTMDDYLPLANVDAARHYFKTDIVLEWLQALLNSKK